MPYQISLELLQCVVEKFQKSGYCAEGSLLQCLRTFQKYAPCYFSTEEKRYVYIGAPLVFILLCNIQTFPFIMQSSEIYIYIWVIFSVIIINCSIKYLYVTCVLIMTKYVYFLLIIFCNLPKISSLCMAKGSS